MLLIVEGTSRWCWCHPFYYKTAGHIAAIIRKFIEFIDERITSLVTDGGNEWAGIYHGSQRSMDLCGRGRM